MMLGKLDSYSQKNQTGLHSHTLYKINSKWIDNLDIRPETMKALEETIGSTLSDVSVSNIFFGYVSSSKGNRSKNKQMGLYQTKKLLQSKGNQQQNKKAIY